MRRLLLLTTALFAVRLFAATPAETAIKQAVGDIEKQPSYYPYCNSLATAYVRRARETSDAAFYAKAEEALRRSFAIAPGNFEGLKIETGAQLGRHEFVRALETATKLNKIMPDDVSVYGYLVDANVELGNYEDAVTAAQWMLDLRPGNVGGLARASYLRELHGNLAGALELMRMAYDATPPSETGDRAWILTRISHLELSAGDLANAESHAGGALSTFPDYHSALAALAQVRIAQGRYQDAVSLLRKRYDAAPQPANLYALAEARELAGQQDAAAASFRQFERESLAESGVARNSNRELIFYYTDHAHDPAKALAIARREAAQRQDVFTLDAYAWALAASGDYAAAEQQLRKPLAMGVKDSKILSHADAIARHLHAADAGQ